MPSRILLIRHGPSAHAAAPGLIDRAGVERWRSAYDAAGIAPGAEPPAALAAEVARGISIVSSDLTRAVESAQRLAPGRAIATTPLLREVPLPIPSLAIRAPLMVWNSFITIQWGVDILRRRDCPQGLRDRVVAAAAWCEDMREASSAGGELAIVTHGVMRRLLALHFRAVGWTIDRRQGYAPWSAWELVHPAIAPRSIGRSY